MVDTGAGVGLVDLADGMGPDRSLERDVMKLRDLKATLEKEVQETKDKLDRARKQSEMDIQELEKKNREKLELEDRLETLKAIQREKLGPAEREKIIEITTACIGKFVSAKRVDQKDQSSSKDQLTVDIYFFSGADKTGMGLLGGSEGAGSRQISLPIKLDDPVVKLAKNAAKHWGLDERKVFFLDRDGRILPDHMALRDIVLPPQQPSSSSTAPPRPERPEAPFMLQDSKGGGSSGRPAPSGAIVSAAEHSRAGHGSYLGQASTEGSPDNRPGEIVTVEGRNYKLTLVRAGETLQREDLTIPKGEQFHDFTFDQKQLEHDLEQTRKKHGEIKTINPVKMEDIPSLYDLIRKGNDQKKKKFRDKLCRYLEFSLFFTTLSLFYWTIWPSATKIAVSRYVVQGTLRIFTEFQNTEVEEIGVGNYVNITQYDEYSYWMEGPLKRSLIDGELSSMNLYPLSASGYVYNSDDTNVDQLLPFCSYEKRAKDCTMVPENLSNQTSDNKTAVAEYLAGDYCENTAPASAAAANNWTCSDFNESSLCANESFSDTDFTAPEMCCECGGGLRPKCLMAGSSVSIVGEPALGCGRLQETLCTLGGGAAEVLFGDSGKIYSYENLTTCPNADSCFPRELMGCLNPRVVRLYDDAREDSNCLPQCRPHAAPTITQELFYSWLRNGWTHVEGKVNSYANSNRVPLNLSGGEEGFINSVKEFKDWEYDDQLFVAKVFLVFVYSPSVNAVFVYKLLSEHTLSGSILCTVSFDVVSFVQDGPGQYVLHFFVIMFTCMTASMELRRVLGCPSSSFVTTEIDEKELKKVTKDEDKEELRKKHRKKELKDQRESCSCCLVVFLLLPLLELVTFVLFWIRNSRDADSVLVPSGELTDGRIDESAEEALWVRYRMSYFEEAMELILCVIFNVLFGRYMLMYFPELQNTTSMVGQLAKPLLYTLFSIIGTFGAVSVTLYAEFGSKFYRLRSVIPTLVSSIRFAQGGIANWYSLYEQSPTVFTLVVFSVFIFVTLILNNLALAIMLSFKRERDLITNYTYHREWQSGRQNKKGADNDKNNSFNPATAGWQFWVETSPRSGKEISKKRESQQS